MQACPAGSNCLPLTAGANGCTGCRVLFELIFYIAGGRWSLSARRVATCVIPPTWMSRIPLTWMSLTLGQTDVERLVAPKTKQGCDKHLRGLDLGLDLLTPPPQGKPGLKLPICISVSVSVFLSLSLSLSLCLSVSLSLCLSVSLTVYLRVSLCACAGQASRVHAFVRACAHRCGCGSSLACACVCLCAGCAHACGLCMCVSVCGVHACVC